MNRFHLPIGAFSIVVALFAFGAGVRAQKAGEDWDAVAKALGRAGNLSADGVYKVTFPRTKLRVTLGGERVPAGMGLTSWAAFTRISGGRAMVMGDTVMLSAEINQVVDALRFGGIEVVAVHNHMAGEQPKIYFLHYQGRGNPAALARTVRRALDRLGEN